MEDRGTYFEDLSPCSYFGETFIPATPEKMKAVGWLARGWPYPKRQGEMPEASFRQLLRLLEDPWELCHCMGWHLCQFCPPAPPVTAGKTTLNRKFTAEDFNRRRLERYGFVVHFGITNFFVPGEGLIYVAPSMIAHYIDAHAYEPPAVFWEAVMKCPEMWSDAYGEALILNGPTNEKWKFVAGQMKSEREHCERLIRDRKAAHQKRV